MLTAKKAPNRKPVGDIITNYVSTNKKLSGRIYVNIPRRVRGFDPPLADVAPSGTKLKIHAIQARCVKPALP